MLEDKSKGAEEKSKTRRFHLVAVCALHIHVHLPHLGRKLVPQARGKLPLASSSASPLGAELIQDGGRNMWEEDGGMGLERLIHAVSEQGRVVNLRLHSRIMEISQCRGIRDSLI